MKELNLESLCHSVAAMAREIGREIRLKQKELSPEQVHTKDFHDYVTEVDKYAEEQIVERLHRLLPGSSFKAEEGTGATQSSSDLEWVIDPIDGTTNFIHGLPVYAISIALKKEGKLALGVVYEVVQEECFYAWNKEEAFLNGNKIQVSHTKDLGPSLLATGFPFRDFSKMDNYSNLLKELMQHSSGIRRYGSAAVDLVYVACGRFDAYFEYALKEWDVAAGIFILEAAGGICSDFSGEKDVLDGSEILASNPYLYQELQQKLHSYFKA